MSEWQPRGGQGLTLPLHKPLKLLHRRPNVIFGIDWMFDVGRLMFHVRFSRIQPATSNLNVAKAEEASPGFPGG
jgi:hypothetical protein